MEHVVARQHGEDDSPDNLALACPDCNRHKGPNLTTLDTRTGDVVRLFHPRHDDWEDHFEFRGAVIVGRSGLGEATTRLLRMNSEDRLRMREAIQACGEM